MANIVKAMVGLLIAVVVFTQLLPDIVSYTNTAVANLTGASAILMGLLPLILVAAFIVGAIGVRLMGRR